MPEQAGDGVEPKINKNPFRRKTDLQGQKGLTKPENPTGDVHYGPFGEIHLTAARAEEARKKSMENPKTYFGPLGESYSSFEEAENARQRHVRQMIADNNSGQAKKDELKLGNSARSPEQQGLSGGLNNTPKSQPKI